MKTDLLEQLSGKTEEEKSWIVIISSIPDDLQKDVEVVAIFHWFNQDILNKLNIQSYEQLKNLPFVKKLNSSDDAQEKYTIQEKVRQIILKHLWNNNHKKFLEKSEEAAEFFLKLDDFESKIEEIYHLSIFNSEKANQKLIEIVKQNQQYSIKLEALNRVLQKQISSGRIQDDKLLETIKDLNEKVQSSSNIILPSWVDMRFFLEPGKTSSQLSQLKAFLRFNDPKVDPNELGLTGGNLIIELTNAEIQCSVKEFTVQITENKQTIKIIDKGLGVWDLNKQDNKDNKQVLIGNTELFNIGEIHPTGEKKMLWLNASFGIDDSRVNLLIKENENITLDQNKTVKQALVQSIYPDQKKIFEELCRIATRYSSPLLLT